MSDCVSRGWMCVDTEEEAALWAPVLVKASSLCLALLLSAGCLLAGRLRAALICGLVCGYLKVGLNTA